jgi:hypothetical protein
VGAQVGCRGARAADLRATSGRPRWHPFLLCRCPRTTCRRWHGPVCQARQEGVQAALNARHAARHARHAQVEIHDGPYNRIKNWDYVGLARALHNGEGRLFATRVSGTRVDALAMPGCLPALPAAPAGCRAGWPCCSCGRAAWLCQHGARRRPASAVASRWLQVRTEAELAEALKVAQGEHEDSLCLIECIVHRRAAARGRAGGPAARAWPHAQACPALLQGNAAQLERLAALSDGPPTLDCLQMLPLLPSMQGRLLQGAAGVGRPSVGGQQPPAADCLSPAGCWRNRQRSRRCSDDVAAIN